MFRDTPVDRLAQNFLVIGIQPNEGIGAQFNAKMPGPSIAIGGVGMNFKYEDYFDVAPSTGYETLIYDCMIGDAILFRAPTASRRAGGSVQPFLDAWHDAPATRSRDLSRRQRRPDGGRRAAGAGRPPLAADRVSVAMNANRSPNIDRGRRSLAALAEAAARRLIGRVAAKGPRRDLPDRRIEPARALSPARRRALAQQSAVGPRALVHRRRPLRSGKRSAQQYGHGAARCFSTASARRGRISIRSRPTPPIPKARRAATRTI